MSIPDDLLAIEAAVGRIRAELSPPSDVRVVRAGENLQLALESHEPLELEAGATWEGTFTLPIGTRLTGRAGSAIHAPNGSALIITPGTRDVQVKGLRCTAKTHGAAILVGFNTKEQARKADAPFDITFTDVHIPTHRGKRGFELNSAKTSLLQCSVRDMWSTALEDSMGVGILNAVGDITITGGFYEAASENICVGGDTMKMVDVEAPDTILVEDVTLNKPMSWFSDGVARKVKNLFELKSGIHVTLRKATLRGCWRDGQSGWAIVLTPTNDGTVRNPLDRSGIVEHVLFEDIDVRDTASGINAYGYSHQSITARPLDDVIFRRMTLVTNTDLAGGSSGRLLQTAAESKAMTFDQCVVILDGSALAYIYDGDMIDPQTLQKRKGGLVGPLTFTKSHLVATEWGIMVRGAANAANWQAGVSELDVTDNVFGGSKAMQSRLPQNEYLSREDFDARFVDAPRGDYRLGA